MGILNKAFGAVETASRSASQIATARAEMVTRIAIAVILVLALIIVFALNPTYAVLLVALALVALYLWKRF